MRFMNNVWFLDMVGFVNKNHRIASNLATFDMTMTRNKLITTKYINIDHLFYVYFALIHWIRYWTMITELYRSIGKKILKLDRFGRFWYYIGPFWTIWGSFRTILVLYWTVLDVFGSVSKTPKSSKPLQCKYTKRAILRKENSFFLPADLYVIHRLLQRIDFKQLTSKASDEAKGFAGYNL